MKIHKIELSKDIFNDNFIDLIQKIPLENKRVSYKISIPVDVCYKLSLASDATNLEIEEEILKVVPFDLDEVIYVSKKDLKGTTVVAIYKPYVSEIISFFKKNNKKIHCIYPSSYPSLHFYSVFNKMEKNAWLMIAVITLFSYLFISYVSDNKQIAQKKFSKIESRYHSLQKKFSHLFKNKTQGSANNERISIVKHVLSSKKNSSIWLEKVSVDENSIFISGYVDLHGAKEVVSFVRQLKRDPRLVSINLKTIRRNQSLGKKENLYFELN